MPLSKDEIEQVKLSRSLQDLERTEGWKLYKAFLQKATMEWHAKVLAPAAGMDAVLASEYAKGAVWGLTYAMNQPDIIIQVTKDTILSKLPANEVDQ